MILLMKLTAFPAKPPQCDYGWVAYNRSCYRLFYNRRLTWEDAKKACRDTGGHLVRIDSFGENKFLSNSTRPYFEHFWIGLNDIEVEGKYVWEFQSNFQSNYELWHSGHGSGSNDDDDCVVLLGGYNLRSKGLWDEAPCSARNAYICEKEEGKDSCPEGWIPYSDTCYQFNMNPTQKMTWSEAFVACKSVLNFASLVTISGQKEQDFISKRIHDSSSNLNVWIGLSDIKNETVFRWSIDKYDLSTNDYQLWANGIPSENKESSDCVMMLGVRQDSAWTVQNCSLKQNFICTRNRDQPKCNVPLGMEDKNILDAQITASSSLSGAHIPGNARLGHPGSWCPKRPDKDEYLQVDLLSQHDVRGIVTKGNVTKYILRISKDGMRFKDETGNSGYSYDSLTLPLVPDLTHMASLYSVTARFLRIYPQEWKGYPCLNVEIIGCPAQVADSAECSGKNWEKGPGNLCYQINNNQMAWEGARSVCLDQGADLLSIGDVTEKKALALRLSQIHKSYISGFWISLNDRDYKDYYYWSNNEANDMFSSGIGDEAAYKPNHYLKACVKIDYRGEWKHEDCSHRFPFICMKRNQTVIRKDIIRTGPTGVWMSSARYYWPLSSIDNNMVLGTRYGKVNGKVTPTSGVKEKNDSALSFSGEGSYADFGKFVGECFIAPGNCSNGFTLSFMASFDQDALNWSKRVNILDSVGNEMEFSGFGVYINTKYLWFVVSKNSEYVKTKVPIANYKTWYHYVMRWNGSDIHISVNGQPIFTKSKLEDKSSHPSDKSRNFVIGIPAKSNITSGEVNLAMVAFWENTLSNEDIALIYKAEFGNCPYGWLEYGMSCYQFNADKKDFNSASLQCHQSGGHLLYVDSNVEQSLFNQGKGEFWIGVFRVNSRDDEFKKSNMEAITYSNWNKGEGQYTIRGDCVIMVDGGEWQLGWDCSAKLPYICEKQRDIKEQAMNSSVKKISFGCDSKDVKLECPSELVINISTAFWGVRERYRCDSKQSFLGCGVKEIPTTTATLHKLCDHSRTCEFRAWKHTLGDPCPGINKYLEVNYSCVKQHDFGKCKSGWTFFHGACYRLFDTPKTWNESRMKCEHHGAELLSVSSKLEQSFATSRMERAWYSNVWIGLNDVKTKGVYEWSDGSPVLWTNWYVGQPDERRIDKSCVYMSLNRGKRGWMYWSDHNCVAKFSFICKYSVAPKQKPKPPTGGSYESCHKNRYYKWKTRADLDACYLYVHHSKSWLDALDFCKKGKWTRYDGLYGELVTIRSKEENEFLRSLTNGNTWIGLESRGVFRGHVWSDGQPVRYTNWEIDQPDSYNGLEACVEMIHFTGRWRDVNCNARKSFFCRMDKKKINVYPPKVYPKPVTGSPFCKKGWILYQGMCYMAGKNRTSDLWTWDDAEKKCQKFNAHLTSITNEGEQKFIEYLVKRFLSGINSFWIGLNDIASESIYHWSDGSPFYYGNWAYLQPNDKGGQEDCVASTDSYWWQWKDQPCQMKFSYICKSYNESYKPPPTSKPTRPTTDGYCPPGWIAHTGHCYRFNTDPSKYKSWSNARNACRKGLYSSEHGDLVTIHNVYEQAFIVSHLKGLKKKQGLWIGLNSVHQSGKYVWADGKSSNYLNWDPRRVSSIFVHTSQCVQMSHNRWLAGVWDPINCNTSNGYICKKAASNTPLTTTPKSESKERNQCPTSYQALQGSCYKFVNSHKTFDEARKTCERENAHLMVVDSHIKQAVLIYISERYIGNVWIGLVREPYSAFKFVDHRTTTYTNWRSEQPDRQLSQRSCVQAVLTTSNPGEWDDMDCSTANSFVCEIYKGAPKVQTSLDTSCRHGWLQYDKSCYKPIENAETWTQANLNCVRLGANLVSIANKREEDFLMFYHRKRSISWFWTGLNDRQFESHYSWSDNSPLVYVNWDKNESRKGRANENCVKMHSETAFWNRENCNTILPYMCKRQLECFSVIPIDSSMVTVTDPLGNYGADKAILTDENAYDSTWCTNNTSGTAKIMVDFDELVQVTAISFQGRDSFDESLDVRTLFYVKSFRFDYKRNGHWRPYYVDDYHTTIQRNLQGNDVRKATFKHPITLEALSVTPLAWFGKLICMKIRLHGCPYVCQKKILSVSPYEMKDDLVSASSTKDPKNEAVQVAMEGNAWCAKTNNNKQWLQFNFKNRTRISKIMTAGNKIDSFVKKYKLQYSDDSDTWNDYQQTESTKIFHGNHDVFHGVTQTLMNPIETYFLRIIPIKWNASICMRISLFGCKPECDRPLLAPSKSNFKVQDSSTNNVSNLEYASFNLGEAFCTENTREYLEVELGSNYRITNIATELTSPSSRHQDKKISTFVLKYRAGVSWIDYDIDGQAKEFIAINNTSRSRTMVNALTNNNRDKNGLLTSGIRIYPNNLNERVVCMMVELYGCPAGTEVVPKTYPLQPTTDIITSYAHTGPGKAKDRTDELSSGAVAGLSIGTLFLCVLVVGISVFLVRRKRAHSRRTDYPVLYSKTKARDDDEI